MHICQGQDILIFALGSQAGTNKTTPGTPDTYFPDNNGKYIFVEYTVQQDSIFNKLSDDIDKCLDEEKTHIRISSISEIICCFTSSNLTQKRGLMISIIAFMILIIILKYTKAQYSFYLKNPIIQKVNYLAFSNQYLLSIEELQLFSIIT